MARATTTTTTTVTTTQDISNVLWSFALGEQLEFNVTISFIPNLQDYIIEAVVVEADNASSYDTYPTNIQPNGKKLRLTTRLHELWDPEKTYVKGELIRANLDIYERIVAGQSYLDPSLDTANWALNTTRTANELFIKFPSHLGDNWTTKPSVEKNAYGFFELRVTEPTNNFPRTWKPIRGLVELAFSPTALVADSTTEGSYDNT